MSCLTRFCEICFNFFVSPPFDTSTAFSNIRLRGLHRGRKIYFYHFAEVNSLIVGKFKYSFLAVPKDCQLLKVAVGRSNF